MAASVSFPGSLSAGVRPHTSGAGGMYMGSPYRRRRIVTHKADFADACANSPLGYSNMRSASPRFRPASRQHRELAERHPINTNPPGKAMRHKQFLTTAVKTTSIKYANVRSKSPRFSSRTPGRDPKLAETFNKGDIYDTDTNVKMTLNTSIAKSPRQYHNLRSTTPRFGRARRDLASPDLGPGSITDGATTNPHAKPILEAVLTTPRAYANVRSPSPRFERPRRDLF